MLKSFFFVHFFTFSQLRVKPEFVESFLPQTLKVASVFLQKQHPSPFTPCMLFFHLALPEKATHIRHYFCHVAFSTSRNPNKQHDAPYTPLYVAFTIFMLLKRQHVTAFVMLLLPLPSMRDRTLLTRHFSEDSCFLCLPQGFRRF